MIYEKGRKPPKRSNANKNEEPIEEITSKLLARVFSVFIRLECGYWSADAEKRLRAAMAH